MKENSTLTIIIGVLLLVILVAVTKGTKCQCEYQPPKRRSHIKTKDRTPLITRTVNTPSQPPPRSEIVEQEFPGQMGVAPIAPSVYRENLPSYNPHEINPSQIPSHPSGYTYGSNTDYDIHRRTAQSASFRQVRSGIR